jgi:hypothetical protein
MYMNMAFQYCLEFLHYLKLAPKFSSRLGGGPIKHPLYLQRKVSR